MRSPAATSAAVFLFALLVTGLLVASLGMVIRKQDRQTFDVQVSRTLDAIQERIVITSNLVRGTAGLFHASEEISAEDFRRYVEPLDLRQRHPGILGIGFSRRLDPAEVPAFVATMRAADRPQFRIWPDTPRDEYHAIAYLEPLDRRNAAALGFDMFTEPVRRAAMTAARERGELVASGKVTLVQELERKKQAGFLMYLPIYRRRQTGQAGSFLGFVYSPLRVDDLLAGTRGKGAELIDYEVFDGLSPHPSALLRTTLRQDHSAPARFAVDHRIEVAGRPWLVRFRSTPELNALSLRGILPWLALAALIASAILARLSWLQGVAKREAEAAAEAQRDAARALHHERESLAATLGSIGDAVIAVDVSDRVTWMNAVAERLTGWSRNEALGQPLQSLAHATPLEGAGERAALRLAELGSGEAMLRTRDGSERPVDHNSAPIRDPAGADSGAVIVIRDASDRYRVQDELRANDRRKDVFLAMLAHELRNPLAPISTAATLLAMPSVGKEQVRHISAIVTRQVKHMIELLDDLLDVSRVTRGLVTLNRERFDLRESLQAGIEQVRALVDSSRHDLDVRVGEEPLWVFGDRTRLTQVVANLLNNAAKYTPPGGHVSLTATIVDRSISIRIADTGVGIDPKLLPHVFDLFIQGERMLDRSQGGLGIGLALVRTIVKLHGGTVQAQSAGADKGSVFTVELPAAEPADAQTQPRAGAAAGASREEDQALHIGVVDDNEDAAATVAILLESQGYRVSTFPDAELALLAADDDPADIYIVDIGLPGMNGHQLAERLRLHPRTAGSTLFALSGYGQPADLAASRVAGFKEHFVKPVDPARLLAAMEQVEMGSGPFPTGAKAP